MNIFCEKERLTYTIFIMLLLLHKQNYISVSQYDTKNLIELALENVKHVE